jgi:hypothetical protein
MHEFALSWSSRWHGSGADVKLRETSTVAREPVPHRLAQSVSSSQTREVRFCNKDEAPVLFDRQGPDTKSSENAQYANCQVGLQRQ